MSETNSAWPFEELASEDGLDIDKIFGTAPSSGSNPFETVQEQPAAAQAAPAAVNTPPTAPSTDFFGLRTGAILCFPKSIPAQ